MFGSNEINVTNKHTIPLHLDFRKETQKDCTYALDGRIFGRTYIRNNVFVSE